jgi:hypothetical protein
MTKKCKKLQLEKNLTYPWAYRREQREHAGIQKIKFVNFFLFLRAIFALLESVSDPHLFQCRSESSFLLQFEYISGSREPNQCGSGSRSWSDFAVTKGLILMKNIPHFL